MLVSAVSAGSKITCHEPAFSDKPDKMLLHAALTILVWNDVDSPNDRLTDPHGQALVCHQVDHSRKDTNSIMVAFPSDQTKHF